MVVEVMLAIQIPIQIRAINSSHPQQLKRQLASAQDKIARLQRQQGMKRESVEQKLAKLKEEYSVISGERAAVQAKIDENKRIVDELERKVR